MGNDGSRTMLTLYIGAEDSDAAHHLRLHQPQIDVVRVDTVRAALGAMAVPVAVAGVVMDADALDDPPDDAAAALRGWRTDLPVMAITSRPDGALVNAMYACDVALVSRPGFEPNLRIFLERIDPAHRARGRWRTQIDRAQRDFGLTPREARIIVASLDGVPRNYLAESMGITENTVKTHIRSLLQKMDRTSLSDAIWTIRNLCRND